MHTAYAEVCVLDRRMVSKRFLLVRSVLKAFEKLLHAYTTSHQILHNWATVRMSGDVSMRYLVPDVRMWNTHCEKDGLN